LTGFPNHGWARFAAAGVIALALGLSACGRKGPLDPPPSAGGAAVPSQEFDQPVPSGAGQSAAPRAEPGFGRDGKAVAPPPSGRQPFILDWLVN